ncbi:MAG: iduronate-2-sulfatase [Acidobacteria bacterium]|nr:MAG: iduronate-2-sulfatase [Acidobacteriota bacterium]
MGAAGFALPLDRLTAAQRAASGTRPNVLFIAIDDLNHWVGYLGRNRQTITPHIDNLASRGVWFSRGYCPAPVCNASRAALMSGLRPSATGVYENDNDWRTVISEDKMLTTAFRNAGYFVCGSGKIYHEAFTRRSEWDDYLERPGANPVPKGTDDGVGGIKFAPLDCSDEDMQDYRIATYGIEQLQKKHDKPFFLAVGIKKPHMPWNVPRKYYDMHPLQTIELPPYREDDMNDIPPSGIRMAHPETDHEPMLKSGRWKEAVRAYLATITFCDAMVGRLLEALDKSEYKDNTIVCFWSDHGWHLGEKHHWRKFSLWEEATRAPMIWVVPGLTKAGVRCDRTVDDMCIYPTLTELCGVQKPAHVDGHSIRKLLADPAAAWSTPAITTYEFMNHAVRSEGWRYIRYANGDEELYDEARDEFEWANLAGKPEYSAKKAELARWLPKKDAPDIGGVRSQGAEEGMPVIADR